MLIIKKSRDLPTKLSIVKFTSAACLDFLYIGIYSYVYNILDCLVINKHKAKHIHNEDMKH